MRSAHRPPAIPSCRSDVFQNVEVGWISVASSDNSPVRTTSESRGMLGDNRHPPYSCVEQAGADLQVLGVREEAFLRLAIRKAQDEHTVDVMTHFALQCFGDLEVVTECAAGGFEQRCNFSAILGVLVLVGNEQHGGHIERHRKSSLSCWRASLERSPLACMCAAVHVEHLARDE